MMDGAEMGEQRPAEVMLHEDEEINELLRRGYRIIQKKSGFRFGIDAVLLSWFAGAVGEEEHVIDLGSGTGVIPLLMDARNGRGQYLGLEIDPRMTEMASRSAEINGCTERVHFVTGDLREASKRLGTGSFDVVTANPPYRKTGTGKLSPDPMKAAARHEVLCTLRDVIREAAALLRSGGTDEARTVITEILTDDTESSLSVPESAVCHRNAAEILCSAGEYVQARIHAEKAMTLRSSAFGPDSPWTADAQAVFAHVLFCQGQTRHACELMESACRTMAASWQPWNGLLASAQHLLSDMQSAT